MRKTIVLNHIENILVYRFFLCLLVIVSFSSVEYSYGQTPEQIKFYSERIEFGTNEVKRNTLHDLRNFETETASRIAIPALADSSAIVRATATHSVVFLPQNEAAQSLLPLMKDNSPFVRRETAYALGIVGSPKSIETLQSHLIKDKKHEVRTACAIALGKIGDSRALPKLVSVLKRKPKKKETFLRRATARAIGNTAMQSRGEKKPVVTPESFLPAKYKNIKPTESFDQSKFQTQFHEANRTLIKLLSNKKEADDVRREAVFALGEIGDKSALAIIKKNINSEDYYLAEISKEALRKIKHNLISEQSEKN